MPLLSVLTVTRPSIEIPWWFDTEEGRIMIEISFRVRKKLGITNTFEYKDFVKQDVEDLPLFQQSAWALTQIVKTRFENENLIDEFHREILAEDDKFFEKRDRYFNRTGTIIQTNLIEIID